jgi:hypothetical protein
MSGGLSDQVWTIKELIEGGVCMVGDEWPGPWDEEFPVVRELGCAYTFIGFVLFVAVAIILWRVFF